MNLKNYLKELNNMNKLKSKIILVVGSTGVGKTKLSVLLAKYFNAEVFNTDSRYLYKEPLIATAKVTKEEMDNVKHHMIDTISLNDDYSIYDFQKDGRKLLDKLISENKNIVIVGGSGLYIKALLYDYNLSDGIKNNIDLSKLSNEELKSKLDSIYIDNNIHINNRKRIERYLTYYYNTGETLTKSDSINNKIYDFITIGLETERDNLYNRINNRVDNMFDSGLLDEAIKLKDYKHFKDIIGYRELACYFDNKISLEEAKNDIKKNTRHYAKRQVTWFKNQMKDINWINTDYNNFNNTVDEAIKIIENTYK